MNCKVERDGSRDSKRDSESVANAFRRWGYLQAQVDSFDRLPHFPHEEIDSLSGDEAERYRKIYCGSVGVEFMHIPFPERTRWLAERLEAEAAEFDRHYIQSRLMKAELFEKFLHTRYVGAKRFSLEGCAALIPLLDGVIAQAGELGFKMVLIGMSHRGRLTAMHLIAQAEASKLFAGFEDAGAKEVLGSGDVKYHRGATGTYKTPTGKELHVRLASNPSHLEAVNPIVLGRTRGEQERRGDTERHGQVLAVILHGDAAFAGQGITAECLNFAELEGFDIGGAVNIVVNNLIGFTATSPKLHSSRFATSVALRLPIPIFHVNAEDPDAVARVAKLAMDYKQTFLSEIVIDLIGFRRFGHNEADDPSVTSPTLYKRISSHPLLYKTYAARIGMSEEEVKAAEREYLDFLEEELKVGRAIKKHPSYFTIPDYWKPYLTSSHNRVSEVDTGVAAETLRAVADRLAVTPEGFTLHPKMKKLFDDRSKMYAGEKNLDWGAAEVLCYGSLLWQGHHVRLVGQDSCRGTFNHRQAVFYDHNTGAPYIPLNNLGVNLGVNLTGEQARFSIYDSMLSEAASLGFEYGYSRQHPEGLICWEAQFGDFVNGAQIIIDQFICAAEDKWGLLSGLTMLLPHGYEGMGPEHSSARVERFLQLAAEDNIQVCQPSTAAQYYHLLRRQVLRKWRKPLVVFTPKSMLRLPASSSPIAEFTSGRYRNVLPDTEYFQDAETVLLCSGKISHELRKERRRIGQQDTAILTIEQFYPFPELELKEAVSCYPNLHSITWVQEEPANMGALTYIKPKLEAMFGVRKISTVKRSASASPATGSHKAHDMEQHALVQLALSGHLGTACTL